MEQKLKEILTHISTSTYSPADIREDTDLVMDLQYDSVQWITLIVELEEKFGIEFEDELLLMESLQTYGQLKNTLSDMLKKEASR